MGTTEYLSFYEPTHVGYGESTDQSFVGAGGGLSLVTECSGQIYLLAMHGTAVSLGDLTSTKFEYLQVFRVSKNEAREIQLNKVLQQRDDLGRSAMNSFSFRWAGGTFVTMNGRLAIMNTERRNNVKNNDSVNGHIHLGRSR